MGGEAVHGSPVFVVPLQTTALEPWKMCSLGPEQGSRNDVYAVWGVAGACLAAERHGVRLWKQMCMPSLLSAPPAQCHCWEGAPS